MGHQNLLWGWVYLFVFWIRGDELGLLGFGWVKLFVFWIHSGRRKRLGWFWVGLGFLIITSTYHGIYLFSGFGETK